MESVDIAIIGAGVVGLAVARELSGNGRTVALLEKNPSFGQETSSRNSEVIHAGLYYPEGSLKSKLCLEGNRMLYGICEAAGIGHRKTGKLVVAADRDEEGRLQDLFRHARSCGVDGLEMIPEAALRKLEPSIAGISAMLSPRTGIISSHELMFFYYREAKKDCHILFNSAVTAVEPQPAGFEVEVNREYRFKTRILINAAGLGSDTIAAMAGIDIDSAGYRLHPCKGEYYSLNRKFPVERLVYPVPGHGAAGLGVHITIDLAGRLRLGPSAYYVDTINYGIDDTHRNAFYESARRLLPALLPEDIAPDTTGIRPKLQGPGDPVRDFVIREESDRGLPGLINLIGIESPGLTASPAIAHHVRGIVDSLLC